jgi:hypothetical protein
MLRPTTSQSVSQSVSFGVKHPTWAKDQIFISQTVAGLLMWGALSDKKTGLSLTVVADPRQRSHSRIRFPRDLWPYFTVSDSRAPNLEGQVPIFVSPRNRVTRLYPHPDTGFPFRRLLRLAGLRWRYSNPTPHGESHTFWVRVTLRLAVYSQSVRLGAKPLENHDQRFVFYSWILAVIVLM